MSMTHPRATSRAAPGAAQAGPVAPGSPSRPLPGGLLWGLYLLFVLGLAYAIWDGPLVDVILAREINQLTVGLLVLSVCMAVAIMRVAGRCTPSLLLWLFFLVFALLGPPGARIYLKTFGLYHGRYDIISDYPLFVWTVGSAALLVGVLLVHLLVPIRIKTLIAWDRKRSAWALWLVAVVAAASTAYVLAKIGYLPIFKGNIGAERGLYDRVAGEYVLKFSRLWFIAAPVSGMFLFLGRGRLIPAALMLASVLALMVYGQRIFAVIGLISIALLYAKFRPIKPRWIAYGAALGVALLLMAEWRGGSHQNMPLSDLVVMNAAREWKEYAIIVNRLHSNEQFYGEKLFVGALAPLLPKQVWELFDVDKQDLVHKFGANFVFGAEFHDPIGIRIGTIGEAYAGYGLYWGVCLQLFLYGLIFGLLEKTYFRLHPADARLVFISFLMALLLILPINTLYVTTAFFTFFGFFHLLTFFVGRNWRPIRLEQPSAPASAGPVRRQPAAARPQGALRS